MEQARLRPFKIRTQVALQQTSVGDACSDCRRMRVVVIVLLLVLATDLIAAGSFFVCVASQR
jgi:hypothetical protein